MALKLNLIAMYLKKNENENEFVPTLIPPACNAWWHKVYCTDRDKWQINIRTSFLTYNPNKGGRVNSPVFYRNEVKARHSGNNKLISSVLRHGPSSTILLHQIYKRLTRANWPCKQTSRALDLCISWLFTPLVFVGG